MEPQPQLVIVRRNSGELRLIIPLYICLETFHLVPLKRMNNLHFKSPLQEYISRRSLYNPREWNTIIRSTDSST